MLEDRLPRYLVISPVKDEERYVELTLRSLTEQTLPPSAWIVVDDGSRDRTAHIVMQYAGAYPFIRLVEGRRGGARYTGSPVIRAFNTGLAHVRLADYDFVVKLDCDLRFEPDYFARLLGRFAADPRLGIASGVYLERNGVGAPWLPVGMPSYHAFGACKVVRRRCFEEIGGFVAAPGWDTVDEIKAWHRRWTTQHFPDLRVEHHKREGSAIGWARTSRMHGEIFYATGGGPLLMLLKTLRRVTAKPVGLNALALMTGYLGAALRRAPKLVTGAEAAGYRRRLRRRVKLGQASGPGLEAVKAGR